MPSIGTGDSPSASEDNRLPHSSAMAPAKKNATHYNMEHKERGLALIFNHENFSGLQRNLQSSPRTVDCVNFKNTLESLGFEVHIHSDCTVSEINQVILEVALDNHSDRDCLFIAVLSYGQNAYLYARDGVFNLDSLWTPFFADNCPTLAGKPKIFFIHASKPNARHCDSLDNAKYKETETGNSKTLHINSYKIPVITDFLIVYSTSPDLQFMQALSEELKSKGSSLHLLNIILAVKQLVDQNPVVVHQLTRLIKFSRNKSQLQTLTSPDEPPEVTEGPQESCQQQQFELAKELGHHYRNLDKPGVAEKLVEKLSQLSSIGKPIDESGKKRIQDELSTGLQNLELDVNVPQQSGSTSQHDPLQKYKMDYSSRGLALIIAHSKFQVPGWDHLSYREGCCQDIAQSTKCFTNLGFEVRPFIDKTKEEIIDFVNAVSREDHSERSCLVVIVSTHGVVRDCILSSDDIYHISTLLEPFQAENCGSLNKKPKLIFIQSCRGDNVQSYIELHDGDVALSSKQESRKTFLQYKERGWTAKKEDLPWPDIQDDFLLFFSTIPDHASFHNKCGSWFITALCKMLEKHTNCDIDDILTNVNRKIAIDYVSSSKDKATDGKKQMSEVISKLRKILIFP